MSTQEYNSVAKHKKYKQKPKFTESVATKWLQSQIYHGVGPQFLGWDFGEHEILEDRSWKLIRKAGPRHWKTPTTDLYKWTPLLNHLQGCFRGLVAKDTKFIPFITVDLDRHSDDVISITHIREVRATGRLLTTKFFNFLGYRLNWCVEVNPKNGSVKFFGWSDRPIPIDVANEIGKSIHEAMRRKGDHRGGGETRGVSIQSQPSAPADAD